MSDPFSDFANLTLGPGGAYQQQMTFAQQAPIGGAVLQAGAAPAGAAAAPAAAPPVPDAGAPAAAAAPVPFAPITATDDAWGLVYEPAAQPGAVVPAVAQTTPGAQAGIAPAAAVAPVVAAAPAAAPPPPPAPSGLPEGWVAYQDQASGKEYYCHAATGQVTWDKPAPQIAAAPAAAPPVPGAIVPAASAGDDPFSVFGGAQPAAGAAAADPFAASPDPLAAMDAAAPADALGALGTAHSADSDAAAGEAEDTVGALAGGGGGDDDFWSTMGFAIEEEAEPVSEEAAKDAADAAKKGRRVSTVRASVANIPCQALAHMADDDAGADRLKKTADGALPSGKTYEATLDPYTFRLGAVFLTAKQCRNNLYCKVANEVIDALDSRPVVAYMSGDAAAHRAGIHAGEILLKVGDQDAKDPKHARELIQSMKRPLTLTMLKPDLPVIVGENQHMCKYNNAKTRAPTQMAQWKAKYCVVGGIAAKPYALLMYYSKADYDRAVASNLAHRHPNVKIKAFDLRGCGLIENQTVHYPGNARVWHFFIITPPPGAEEPGGFPANNIKISHPNREGLVPVLEAVRRAVKKYPTRPAPRYAPQQAVTQGQQGYPQQAQQQQQRGYY